MKVGIIGLGLMGGSFALALKKRYKNKDLEIVGYDRNDQHALEALDLNIVDKVTDSIEKFNNFDLIILAIPVEGIIKTLPLLKNVSKDTTIIDFGSTKEKIIENIPKNIRKNFVAAHPMTGTEKSGPLAADKKLYKGKVVVLCNIEDSGERQRELAKEIFQDLGMKIFYMNAKEHDKHAAFISHMPHIVSYSLANSVLEQEDPKAIIALAGGGFKDMSRIAKSSPNMWIDIFKQNRENLLEAMDAFIDEISKAKNMVKEKNWEELRNWILKANSLHIL